MTILEVRNVSKLFGPGASEGAKLLSQGWDKKRLATEKGITVGVNQESIWKLSREKSL